MTGVTWSGDFDGHRVDVLVPESVRPDTPVLVFNDGMNVFFPEFASTGQTWEIAEAIESGRIHSEVCVVAVWGEGGPIKFNPRRINEFLCDDHFSAQPKLWETLDPRLTPPTREPRGNYYLELVADVVLPAVANRFGLSLNPHRTALVGCSVAGVWSIYAATKRPDVFGSVLSFSSHWEFGGETLVRELAKDWGETGGPFLWSDSGTIELDAGSWRLNELFGQLLAVSTPEPDRVCITQTFAEQGHSEVYWSKRLPAPVNLWLSQAKECRKS